MDLGVPIDGPQYKCNHS